MTQGTQANKGTATSAPRPPKADRHGPEFRKAPALRLEPFGCWRGRIALRRKAPHRPYARKGRLCNYPVAIWWPAGRPRKASRRACLRGAIPRKVPSRNCRHRLFKRREYQAYWSRLFPELGRFAQFNRDDEALLSVPKQPLKRK